MANHSIREWMISSGPALRQIAGQAAMRTLSRRLAPVQEFKDDEFRKSKATYEHLQTVTPVCSPELDDRIQACLHRYEVETHTRIPAAWRWQTQAKRRLFKQPDTVWQSNKPERLRAVFWLVSHLPPAHSHAEAANQVACTLDRVERIAQRRAKTKSRPTGMQADPKPMRLPQPQPETVQGKPIWVSFGIRHVMLFSPTGAIQIQQLPMIPGTVNYAAHAQQAGVVLLDQPNARGHRLCWDTNAITR